ncbi:hypothetical protein SADUNF_Sadunf06G0155200 [Salix dunnii]|uniref:Amino acid transporter transmembrane domain-containing protein n=1 Tax=Salix dunnii TaxID=1413687 RepID=A0A835K7F9_9ROSI|nr:hypothetical protein SADUNF_Sadunf06G0155200 [Salix dunnii]
MAVPILALIGKKGWILLSTSFHISHKGTPNPRGCGGEAEKQWVGLKGSSVRWEVRNISEACYFGIVVVMASFMPGFGEFASLFGSALCAPISFVFPATYHLKYLVRRYEPG